MLSEEDQSRELFGHLSAQLSPPGTVHAAAARAGLPEDGLKADELAVKVQELDTLLRGFLGRGSCPKTGAGDPQQCQALETVLQSLAQRASALASKLSGSSSTSGAIDAG